MLAANLAVANEHCVIFRLRDWDRLCFFLFPQLSAYRDGKPTSNGGDVTDDIRPTPSDVKVKNMHNKVSKSPPRTLHTKLQKME